MVCGYGKNYYSAWWCKEVAQIKVHKAAGLAKAWWGRVLQPRPQPGRLLPESQGRGLLSAQPVRAEQEDGLCKSPGRSTSPFPLLNPCHLKSEFLPLLEFWVANFDNRIMLLI